MFLIMRITSLLRRNYGAKFDMPWCNVLCAVVQSSIRRSAKTSAYESIDGRDGNHCLLHGVESMFHDVDYKSHDVEYIFLDEEQI